MNKTEVREKLLELLGPETDFSIRTRNNWYNYPDKPEDCGWTGERVSIQADIPVGGCPHCSEVKTEFVMTHGDETWEDAWNAFVKSYEKVKDKQEAPA